MMTHTKQSVVYPTSFILAQIDAYVNTSVGPNLKTPSSLVTIPRRVIPRLVRGIQLKNSVTKSCLQDYPDKPGNDGEVLILRLHFLDLQCVQLDRCVTAKHTDHDFDFAFYGVYLSDRAIKALERTIGDRDNLAL